MRMAQPRKRAGTNHVSLRRRNHGVVYQTLWQRDRASRADLALATGLHPATITHIIDDMIARGLVQETGSGDTAAVGRPPIQLEIVASAAYVIGVNLARNGVNAALVDLRGNLQEKVSFGGLNVLDDPQHALNRLVHAVEFLLEDAEKTGKRVLGVGIGVPGHVQAEAGSTYLSPVGQRGRQNTLVQIGRYLQEHINLPLYVDNNANVATLAEQYFGAGRHVENFVLIWCDFGVGGGVVIDGHLHRGKYGGAGEFGHITVATDGPLCACGNHGCLELYAAVPVIRRRAAEVLSLAEEQVTTDVIADAYEQGHQGVRAILQDIAKSVSGAGITITNTLAPDLIIIAGSLGRLAPILAALVQDLIRQAMYAPLNDDICVVGAETSDISVRGAATLLIHEFVMTGLQNHDARALSRRVIAPALDGSVTVE